MSTVTAYRLPLIHRNGTSHLTLITSYSSGLDAVIKAEKIFKEMELSARDYDLQGPDAYAAARKERDEMARKLAEVKAYCRALAIHAVADHDTPLRKNKH